MTDLEEDRAKVKTEMINEYRSLLQRIENLNDTVETKAASYLAFTSVLMTLIIFIFSSILETTNLNWSQINNQEIIFLILSILGLGSFIIGLICLVMLLWPREYMYPSSYDPNGIYQNINKSFEDFTEYILDEYRICIPSHSCIHEEKTHILKISTYLIISGFILSLILLLYTLNIKMGLKIG